MQSSSSTVTSGLYEKCVSSLRKLPRKCWIWMKAWSRPASGFLSAFRSGPRALPLYVPGWGWTRLLYAFFKGGGFKQFFQTELIGSSPVIYLLRRSPLIVIWPQFFIQRIRKHTMCISPQEPSSCLRRRWPLLSRKLSALHLFNDVCHATVNQSATVMLNAAQVLIVLMLTSGKSHSHSEMCCVKQTVLNLCFF